MLTLQDIDAIESAYDDESAEDHYYAIQHAINSGTAWAFQGHYGRVMMDAITHGHCMLGRDQARDYYGNVIPSRDDVQKGTKGSYDYVVKQSGLEWADMMLEA